MSQKTLTAREKYAHWKRAKAMLADGVGIEIPEEWHDCAPLIIETAEYNSEAFDSQGGGSAAYALAVRLIARRSMTLLDCRITAPWDDDIQLANPPLNGQLYQFAGRHYPKSEVLNPQLAKSLMLRAGQIVEGTILACGLRRIPDCHQHGSLSSCTLALIDQYRDENSMDIPLSMDRSWKRTLYAFRRDGKSLYSGPALPAVDMNARSQAGYQETPRQ